MVFIYILLCNFSLNFCVCVFEDTSWNIYVLVFYSSFFFRVFISFLLLCMCVSCLVCYYVYYVTYVREQNKIKESKTVLISISYHI